MLIICWLAVWLHKHPHELLDSVVKERLVKIFHLNRGTHSTAASFAVKWLFSEVFKESLTTSTTCAFDLSSAGGEFYSVTRCCQHLFFNSLRLRWTEATCCRILRNSLINKKFSVSTAPEVGRIIDTWDLPSTTIYAFLAEEAFFAIKRGIRRANGGRRSTSSNTPITA